MNPLVTIIIPVYNGETYLRESIESTLNQTYDNIEIICVNDGSTDGSLKILREYHTQYPDKIRVISQKNKGLAKALNAGLKVMKGKYYKKNDADDILYPNAIEEYTRAAEELGGQDIIYANFDWIDIQGNIIESYHYDNYNHLNQKERNSIILLNGLCGNLGLDFIPKCVFDRCGLFDESLRLSEDYEFQLRMCLLHDVRLYLVPKTLQKIRTNPRSITRSISWCQLESQNEMVQDKVLKQLNIEDQKYYKNSTKRLLKQLPTRTKFRRSYKNILRHTLGDNITYNLTQFYATCVKKQD